MKRLVFLLLAAALATVARADDNLLQNGDFSNGLTHWYGNIQAPEGGADGEAASGALIKLRPDDWTRVTQDFELKPGVYSLHVSFTLSPGTQFSKQVTDYINVSGKLNFPEDIATDAMPGQWVVVVMDPTAQKSLLWTVDASAKPGPQSYTFTIKDIDFSNRQTLLLAFPPGSGVVTFQHIVLVPASGGH